jgi:hypothetical protein
VVAGGGGETPVDGAPDEDRVLGNGHGCLLM